MSDICKTGWESLGFDSYNHFLLSEFWRKKKELILDVKGRRCELCRTTKWLQVHHLHYNTLGNEGSKDVRVLCRKCHEEIHKRGKGDDSCL